MGLFYKNIINNISFRRDFGFKKVACFLSALCLTSALFSQVAPWPSDCSNIANDGNNCPPINCPPLSTTESRAYRGTQLALDPEYMDCPISTTPGEPITAPTITCPVKSIEYSIIEPTTSGAFRQYKSFASPDGNGYGASSQGWINQLYCHKDPVFGLPAPTDSAGFTYIVEYDEIVSSLPAREPKDGDPADTLRDIVNAQLIQFDFWLLLPPTIPTVGLQVGDGSADATVLMLGPDLNNMCPVAEFIETGTDDDGNKVGYGDKTGYYTIPTTGVSQACNANILRARLYITDIAAVWNSSPLLDIGNGFENLTNLPVIATTSGDDNTIPTPVLKSEGTGYVDVNGNVFDINGNWIPVGCQTPGTDATDIAASTVGLSGTTTICSGDAAPSYTISGAPGSMITYNIDGGTDITITLDGTGTATIPASNTASSTFNLVSVNFDGGNSCDLSSTASVTVREIATATVSGTITICRGDPVENYIFTGTPNTVITYTLDGVTATITLNGMGTATLPASNTTSSTVSLVSVAYSDAPTCSQTLTGNESVTIIEPATASVTGGTFCAGTAIFSFSGTPNSIVTYNIDGSTNTSILLDGTGAATIAASNAATLTLVSVAYSGSPSCSQPLTESAEVIIIEPATASVTGGTFCDATAANFSISGTPNTIVTYNLDGAAATSITLDGTGVATVATTVSTILNLVSVAYSSTPNCSQPLTGSAVIIIGGPTCFTPAFTWSFIDPCNCYNSANITLADGTMLFADFIKVDASQYTNPTVSLFLADANFLDNTGAPIVAATATFVDQGGGIFVLPYYTRVAAPASFAVDVDGEQQAGTSTTCVPCKVSVPSLSQWGLLIYGLLVLNLGIGFLYRKKLVFE